MHYDLPIELNKLPWKTNKNGKATFDKTTKAKLKKKQLFVALPSAVPSSLLDLNNIVGVVKELYYKDGTYRGVFEVLDKEPNKSAATLILQQSAYLSPVGVGDIKDGKIDDFNLLYFNLKPRSM